MHIHPAHIRIEHMDNSSIEHIQPAWRHCRNTARFASWALSPISLSDTAYLSGLLHDCGKFTCAFESYLRKAAHGEKVIRGSVNHTFVGVRYLLRNHHSPQITTSDIVSELLAYAVGAHHGLFDLARGHDTSGFAHRLQASPDLLYEQEALNNFWMECSTPEEIQQLFLRSTDELAATFQTLMSLSQSQEEHVPFYMGLLSRLILSAVIQGDRRDTAEFMTQTSQPFFPQCGNTNLDTWSASLAYMEQKLGEFPQESPIQLARNRISELCLHMGTSDRGLYSLNVPTGSGKTLSSLRFALAHSKHQNMQRIFFIMPLLSIIEQNSDVIREFVGNPSLVLEHHSNVVAPQDDDDSLHTQELLTEDWSAPIVITTLVQFLDTLFSGRTTSIRRFHALCDSVIVIDEVQSVPGHMLTLFNLALNFLTTVCKATVVLCSATQPTFEKTIHPLYRSPTPIVPYDKSLWAVFERTTIQYAGSMTCTEISEFLLQLLPQHRSVLIICNKKSTAAQLYASVSSDSFASCYHLSASMCMAHRRSTLEQMNAALRDPQKLVICISTQVIEAGVDISFGCVVRLTAGMDSIIQAAGRCNRNKESTQPAPVYIVGCVDEHLTHLREIQAAQHATECLLAAFEKDPQEFHHSLTSDESISYYYHQLYRSMPDEYQDFKLPTMRTSIYSLLSNNKDLVSDESCQFFMQQGFQTAGAQFSVFDTQTVDVLVPYGEGSSIIADFCSEQAMYDISFQLSLVQRAKPYTISLLQYQRQQLEQSGALTPICHGTMLALNEAYYHEHIGLVMNPTNENSLEVTACDILIL